MGQFDGAPDAKGQIEVPITPHFTNVGGSAFHHGSGAFAIVIDKLPDRPDYTHALPFGGNEINIPIGGIMSPDTVTFVFTPEQARAVKAGTSGLFIYGYVTFLDNAETPFKECFASKIVRGAGGQLYYFPQMGKAYFC